MALTNVIGYIAAGLVFAAFCAKRMVPLRMLAIVSNIGFISYGALLGLWPIVLLHSGMLPMNLVRLHQAFAEPDRSRGLYRAVARSRRGFFDSVLHQLARWREREGMRRELAQMRGRDFGDLAVSPALIKDETQRWPWQGWSPEWSAVARSQKAGNNEWGLRTRPDAPGEAATWARRLRGLNARVSSRKRGSTLLRQSIDR